jgi:hypothetical protein
VVTGKVRRGNCPGASYESAIGVTIYFGGLPYMNRRQLPYSAAALPAMAASSAAATQQKQMRITGIETGLSRQPPGTPHYDAIHTFGIDAGSVVLRNLAGMSRSRISAEISS